jgi:hypothetical protein
LAIARSLEQKIEKMVEGVGARIFGGGLNVLELASRIVRTADLNLTEDAVGPVAPNHFAVTISEGETGREVIERLNDVVEEAAAENGWRMKGPASVEIARDPDVAPGSVLIDCSVSEGHRPAWAYLESVRDQRRLPIRVNRALIGRSRSADVVIADLEVSRGHAILWTEQGLIWIADIGSANGIQVNGTPVAAPASINDGDVITLGATQFQLRTV